MRTNTVVITGSTRGFGFQQAKKFRQLGYNVVITGTSDAGVKKAVAELDGLKSEGKILGLTCNVTQYEDLEDLWKSSVEHFGAVDFWINNAGVNQPDKPVSELTQHEIDFMIDIDLRGAIYGSQIAFRGMEQQGFGQIYNIEGYGSNDAMMMGLTIYGTTKRAITYFTKALAKESEELTGGAVKVCLLTPGIMITDFIKTANGGNTSIELPEKTKKVYNILGDYPETIVDWAVPRMIANDKNNANIVWLSSGRAFCKFLSAPFKKQDFFKTD